MGIVIEFPAAAAARRAALSRTGSSGAEVPHEGSATVLILPAIRIERYTDADVAAVGAETGAAPGRRRRRRERS